MKKINKIKFHFLTSDTIKKYGILEVSSRSVYDKQTSLPDSLGPLSTFLGLSYRGEVCRTCQQCLRDCPGHFGYIKLPLPVFHIALFKIIIKIISSVCKYCGRILLSDEEIISFKLKYNKTEEVDIKKDITKAVLLKCRSKARCPRCSYSNGIVKRFANAFKVVHKPYRNKHSLPQNHLFDYLMNNYKELYNKVGHIFEFLKSENELIKALFNSYETLDPIRVKGILEKVPKTDLKLLGINFRPEKAILDCVPVCPPCTRPSSRISDSMTNEDDLTVIYRDILILNEMLRANLNPKNEMNEEEEVENKETKASNKRKPKIKSKNVHKNLFANTMDIYNLIQQQAALIINSELPGYPISMKQNSVKKGKTIRSLTHRLKGKQGRFRGNLSGKRVNFTSRTVITPDPNIEVDEVGVPLIIAQNLSIPEKVTLFNIKKMKKLVENGCLEHPGAILIESFPNDKHYGNKKGERDENKERDKQNDNNELNNKSTLRLLKYIRNRKFLDKIKNQLKPGDIVHRTLQDGDFALFNRQPSLHRNSIMGHKVRVLPEGRTFRLNLCVCNPYNADFDGDEMNLHAPQSIKAQVDIKFLTAVKENIVNPKTGLPIITPLQDYITTIFLMTRKDCFLNERIFLRLIGSFVSFSESNEFLKETLSEIFPLPALIFPKVYYTGKQVFDVLLAYSLIIKNKENERKGKGKGNIYGDKNKFIKKLVLNIKEKNKYTMLENGNGKKGYFERETKFCPKDGFVLIKNNILVCGSITKGLITSSKNGILSRILNKDLEIKLLEKKTQNFQSLISNNNNKTKFIQKRNKKQKLSLSLKNDENNEQRDKRIDFKEIGIKFMNSLSKLVSEFLKYKGFSIGAEDVKPNKKLPLLKTQSIKNLIKKHINLSFQQNLSNESSDKETERENFFISELGKIRENVSQFCLERLSFQHNSPFIMSLCGSKGSSVNICQMVGCLGQQIIAGGRIENEFENRTLPHFPNSFLSSNGILNTEREVKENIEGKGFVANSFFSGLSPTEFFFHSMAGREGLIDTAVKTSETGYLQRRMIKNLENLVCAYDNTIRSGNGDIVSFKFGDDGKDPSLSQIFRREKNFGSHEGNGFNNCDIDLEEEEKERLLEAGTAIGAISCQAIGEPGTQMTLKTFHFAGTTKMNITLGVPRVVEIINAVKEIKNPLTQFSVSCISDCENAEIRRTMKKEMATKLYKTIKSIKLIQFIECVKRTISKKFIDFHLIFKRSAVEELRKLNISTFDIQNSILKILEKNCKKQIECIEIHHYGFLSEANDKQKVIPKFIFSIPFNLKESLLLFKIFFPTLKEVFLNDLCKAKKIVIQENEFSKEEENKESDRDIKIFIQKNCLKQILGLYGVEFENAYTNSPSNVYEVLGIEAARNCIISEIQYIFDSYGIKVDIRHVYLIADFMSCRGKVFGLTRHDMKKFENSTFKLASFEKTIDCLFDAVVEKKEDFVDGVSSSIILGKVPKIGSGFCEVKQHFNFK